MISFDSNILVYAADSAAGERHRAAVDLLERSIRRGNGIQTLQSFSEFLNVVTANPGSKPPLRRPLSTAGEPIMLVEAAASADLGEGMRAFAVYRIGFWGAMLWATARQAGVRLLFSEDYQDGQTIEGVRILNRFTVHNASTIEQTVCQ